MQRTFPERHGKTWYEGETHYILQRIKQGIPPSKIAKEVSRTTNGITARLKRIGYNSVQKGMTVEDASKLTGISNVNLTESIRRREFAETQKKQRNLEPFVPETPEETVLDVVKEIADLRSRIEVLERRNKPAGSGLTAIRAVRHSE